MNKNPLLIRLYIIPHNSRKQEQQQASFQRWLQKPGTKSSRKVGRKISGGQKGHKGYNLEPVENSDHIERHKVGQCAVRGVTLEDTYVLQSIFRAKLKYP